MEVKLRQQAFYLALLTLGYNLLEGIISLKFGVAEESLALMGFGLDSFVEVGSAAIVIYKLKSMDSVQGHALQNEKKATFLIGLLFVLLAIFTVIAALFKLANHETPQTTLPGLIISAVSLCFMFFLWRSKQRIGLALNSATLMADAQCSLACIKLSLVLFCGSLTYLLWPQGWWIDAVAALTLSFFIGREGREMIGNSRKKDFTGGCGCH